MLINEINCINVKFENIKINMEDRIEEIMGYYKKEVKDNNYLPTDYDKYLTQFYI